MASVLTICSLCVFQYVSVVLPMNKSLTNLRCLVMVLRAWIISIFLATGPAIRNGGAINSIQTFSTTYIITLQTEQIFPTTLPWCFAVIFFLVSSAAWTPIAHGSDVIHLARTGRRCSRFFGNETEFDSVNFGSDISGLSYSVFRLLDNQRFRPSTRFLGQLSFWAIYLHSACHPFIYAFKHPEYQDTLKDIARKFKIAITSTFCCCMSKDGNEEERKEKR